MSYCVEKVGKTVDEAIKLALNEMNAEREDVDIEVIEEGAKGLLGIIGNRDARVKVTLKENKGEKAKKFLFDILNKMDVEAEIDIDENDKLITLYITGKDIGIVIGRRGETLDSLQYLTNLVVNRRDEDYKRIVLDIENYREKREETLIKLANRLADKVIRLKKSITLEPMNPYERRIIHSTLQKNKYIKTYSVGDEPNRKVVITIR